MKNVCGQSLSLETGRSTYGQEKKKRERKKKEKRKKKKKHIN